MRTIASTLRRTLVAGAALAVTSVPVTAQDRPDDLSPYFEDDRAWEIALARSAAPSNVSGDATVMVLTRDGYEVAIDGTNGFTCLVYRSWAAPASFPPQMFWRPDARLPHCFNEAGAESVLPQMLLRTERVLDGDTRDEVLTAWRAALEAGRFPAPNGVAMAYMMSSAQSLPGAGQWHPHVMFYLPGVENGELGGNQPGGTDPFIGPGTEGPFSTAIVVVPEWVDPVQR